VNNIQNERGVTERVHLYTYFIAPGIISNRGQGYKHQAHNNSISIL